MEAVWADLGKIDRFGERKDQMRYLAGGDLPEYDASETSVGG